MLVWQVQVLGTATAARQQACAHPHRTSRSNSRCCSSSSSRSSAWFARAALLQAWRRSALGTAAPLATLAVAQELAPILDTLHSLALLPPLQPLSGGQSR